MSYCRIGRPYCLAHLSAPRSGATRRCETISNINRWFIHVTRRDPTRRRRAALSHVRLEPYRSRRELDECMTFAPLGYLPPEINHCGHLPPYLTLTLSPSSSSRRATFAGVSSSSRDTWLSTEMRRRDRRWTLKSDRSVVVLHHFGLRYFWWKSSRVLASADSKVQVSAAYSNTDKISVRYIRSLVSSVRRLSLNIRFKDVMTAQARPIRHVRSGWHWPSDDCRLPM